MCDQIATLFRNGNCLSIRLPREIQLKGDEIEVRMEGNEIILYFKKQRSWHAFFEKTPLPSEDFMLKRLDSIPQVRAQFF